jgi:hypothetical protein
MLEIRERGVRLRNRERGDAKNRKNGGSFKTMC